MEYKQLSMYDCLTSVPEVWDCRETCRRFGEKVSKFPASDELRCDLHENGDWEQFVFDNTVHFICKLYEPKEKEVWK